MLTLKIECMATEDFLLKAKTNLELYGNLRVCIIKMQAFKKLIM